jgi:putative nucleotidyltransferase with HDIG domain
MLLKDLTTGEIEDLTGTSKKDVKNGVLRGHPEVPLDKMFNEDPLRMLRLVRFNAKYGWKVPKDVIRAVQKNADRIKIVSAERIYGELEKILKLGKLHQAVKFMSVCGLLSYILPEVRALKGVEQDSRHHNEGDVYRHTMMVLKNAPLTIQGQMAALLHDIGKPKSQEYIDGKIKFLGHEEVGAEMTEAILERMKFPKDIADSVTRIVRHHMRPHHLNINGNPSERSIRKFIGEVGDDLEDVLAQALADRQGMLPYIPDVEELKEKVKAVQEKNKALGVDPTKLPLNGSEVMEALNIPRGPMVGEALRLLKTLQDDYLTEGKVLDKDTAILLLRKHFSSQSSHD